MVRANIIKEFSLKKRQLDLSTNRTLSSCYNIEHGITVVPIIDEIQNFISISPRP